MLYMVALQTGRQAQTVISSLGGSLAGINTGTARNRRGVHDCIPLPSSCTVLGRDLAPVRLPILAHPASSPHALPLGRDVDSSPIIRLVATHARENAIPRASWTGDKTTKGAAKMYSRLRQQPAATALEGRGVARQWQGVSLPLARAPERSRPARAGGCAAGRQGISLSSGATTS